MAAMALAQTGFISGSTGADGALVFYAPPPDLYAHAIAYDAGRQQVVLFGGYDPTTGFSNNTWEWNHTQWTLKNPTERPSARQNHAMAYDSVRQVIIMFGGTNNSSTFNDTWEYDGTTWTLKTPVSAPNPRSGHAMVYDAGRQRVVLFGGSDPAIGTLNDTWEYNGTTWVMIAPAEAPSARYEHAMVYDTARQQVVLFGGCCTLNDTWEYDGTTWIQRTPGTTPSGRYAHAMAYDTARQQVVLFGGCCTLNDTWEYDGTTWTQRTPDTAPSGRYAHAMAYDSTHQTTILFGGCCTSRDTWLWNGISWSAPVQTQTSPVIDTSTRPDGIWHYTTIDIPAGVKVSFRSNPGNTPVIWLATGAVHIAGEIDLDGAPSTADIAPGNEAPGGPGGGAGGLGGSRFDVSGSYAGTPGEGLGGGLPGTTEAQYGGSGGYGMPGPEPLGGAPYGNRLIRPLLGGSGGGGGASSDTSNGGNGTGGGGAMLIASSDTIQISGHIHANGGQLQSCGASCGGYGSGGAIRLVANRIEGNGSLAAFSSGGGHGRIRLEAYFVPSNLNINPPHTAALPLTAGLLNAGLIRITHIAGQVVPNPPGGNTNAPDVVFMAAGDVTITLATTQIPPGTPLTVRVTAAGQVISVQSTPTDAAGNATATTTVPAGVGTIQAFATYIPAP